MRRSGLDALLDRFGCRDYFKDGEKLCCGMRINEAPTPAVRCRVLAYLRLLRERISATTPIPNRKRVSGSGTVVGATPPAAQRFNEMRLKVMIDRYFMMISRKVALDTREIN